MLYWFFSTYRETVAVFVAAPLLVAGMVTPIITAYTLGQPGKKVARPGVVPTICRIR